MNTSHCELIQVLGRGGRGGVRVLVQTAPSPYPTVEAQAEAVGHPTAWLSLETPNPMSLPWAAPAGQAADAGAVLLAAYRGLALQGRVPERQQVFIERGRSVFVQEDLFRSAHMALVWLEEPLRVLSPLALRAGALDGLNVTGYQVGSVAVLMVPSFDALGAALQPEALVSSLSDGDWQELVVFSRAPLHPLSDGAFVHWKKAAEQWQAPLASTAAAGLIGLALWKEGRTQSLTSLDQGTDFSIACRLSVWLETEEDQPIRLSIGGQVQPVATV